MQISHLVSYCIHVCFLSENNFLPVSFSKLMHWEGNALFCHQLAPASYAHSCLRNAALRVSSDLANQRVVSHKSERACGPADEAWRRGRAKVRRRGQGLVCTWGVGAGALHSRGPS